MSRLKHKTIESWKPDPKMLKAYRLCIDKGHYITRAAYLAGVSYEDLMNNYPRYGITAEHGLGGLILKWDRRYEY